MEEIIKKLNELKILQTRYDFIDDIPDEYHYQFINLIDEDISINEHRWYETAICVYKVGDLGFIGVRAASKLYSESMSWEDAYHILTFYEMEPIKIISYKVKE
jgi:hypothetical protein